MPKKKTKKKTDKALTPKQLAFCREYIKDHNGTQAAIRAGYSEKTADQQASRLLTNVKVSAAIKKAQDEAWDNAIMGRKEILARLSMMGRSNMADYVTEDGTLDIEQILKDKPVLAEFVVEEWESEKSSGVKRKAKIESPKDALKELGKLQGLHAPDKLEIAVKPEDKVLEEEFRKRVKNMSVDEMLELLKEVEGDEKENNN